MASKNIKVIDRCQVIDGDERVCVCVCVNACVGKIKESCFSCSCRKC